MVRTRPQYFDLTAGLALWLTQKLGRSEEAEGLRRILHQFVGLFLLGVFLFVDLPLSVLLHALDRGSFLLAVAERGPETS
jgi:hypothetical protein